MACLYVCSFHTASGKGRVRGRWHYWDFSQQFGPLFTDASGNELKHQPQRGAAWQAFSLWLTELKDEAMKGSKP